MYSPGSVASMRQGKVSRAQAVKCPENTQGISKGVTTFHPYKTCDFPFSMSLDETYKKKRKISLFACGYSPFLFLYIVSLVAKYKEIFRKLHSSQYGNSFSRKKIF